jgi:hypothetical protein
MASAGVPGGRNDAAIGRRDETISAAETPHILSEAIIVHLTPSGGLTAGFDAFMMAVA